MSWNRLSRQNIFDHCLYNFHPAFYEVKQGENIHMDPASGDQACSTFHQQWFWDTFRPSFPAFALIIPEYYLFLRASLIATATLAISLSGLLWRTRNDAWYWLMVLLQMSACKGMAPELEEEFLKAILKLRPRQIKAVNGRHGLCSISKELGYLSTDYHEVSVIHWTNNIGDFCISTCAANWSQEELLGLFPIF